VGANRLHSGDWTREKWKAASRRRRRSPWTANLSKNTEAGGPRGFDAVKEIKGRKRQLTVDTLGLPIESQITTADVQDRDALALLLRDVRRKSPS
jgi:hypothetical protein